MKPLLLLLVTLCVPSFAKDPSPQDFPVSVHVNASHSDREISGSVPIQNTYTHQVYSNVATRRRVDSLSVTVEGRSYDLKSLHHGRGILDPGDYRARFSEHRGQRTYELLLPNGKTEKFEVVGASE